jgi:hypothetical protein
MEWALDPDALKFALGELPETLAPNELQELLADAELSLFTGAPEVSEELVRCGWFLHAIGSAGGETVDWDRRQRAFRISAHILELAQLGDRPVGEKLELAFGSMLPSSPSPRDSWTVLQTRTRSRFGAPGSRSKPASTCSASARVTPSGGCGLGGKPSRRCGRQPGSSPLRAPCLAPHATWSSPVLGSCAS